MCLSPKMPSMPKPQEPKLPQQPLQAQQPAYVQVGRYGEEDSTKKLKKNRSRRQLRIDKAGAQTPGAITKNQLTMK